MLPAVTENAGPPNHWFGCRRTLIARSRDARVAHHRVDRVIVRQRTIERDAGAERLDGLVARVRKRRRRRETDSGPAIAERHVGRVVELQLLRDREARPVRASRADRRDRDRLDTVANARDVQADLCRRPRYCRPFPTLRILEPAGAAAARRPCVPGLPMAVTVATSYFLDRSRDRRDTWRRSRARSFRRRRIRPRS